MLRTIFISALLSLASFSYFSSNDEMAGYKILSEQTSEEEVIPNEEIELSHRTCPTPTEAVQTDMSKQIIFKLKEDADLHLFASEQEEIDLMLHANLLEDLKCLHTEQEKTQNIAEKLTGFSSKKQKNIIESKEIFLPSNGKTNTENKKKRTYKSVAPKEPETSAPSEPKDSDFKLIPIKDQDTSQWENSFVKVAACSAQGYRKYMEDQYKVVMKLPQSKTESSYFAVFDGHAGKKIAEFASKEVHKRIIKRKEYSEGHFDTAIINGIMECDSEMQKKPSFKSITDGSTAVVCLLRHINDNGVYIGDLYVGNVGDSRCIASVNGNPMPLSLDHKPSLPLEKNRIEFAGGYVETGVSGEVDRVNGSIALSRALGDFELKDNINLAPDHQIISSKPDVIHAKVHSNWDFLLVASDGVWDAMTNSQAVKFVLKSITKGSSPAQACEELVHKCMEESMDNVTAILICFLHKKPYERFVDRCREATKHHVKTKLLKESERTKLVSNTEDDLK